ncbi:cytochrome P450 [Mycobacteroides chelonae]
MNRQDSPENQPARKLMGHFFGNKDIDAMRPIIEDLAVHHIHSLKKTASTEVADAVDHLLTLPYAIMCRLLGLPDTDALRLKSWVNGLIDANDFIPPGHGLDQADTKLEEFREYLLLNCTHTPIYCALRDGWKDANEKDLTDTLMFVAGAGTFTTASLLGVGISMLVEHTSIGERLRSQPDATAAFVQECLRYDPPVQFTARWTTRRTQLHNRWLPEETMVLVCIGAAGRDPEKYLNPDRFDVDRYLCANPPRTLSFGVGHHFCVGSRFAALIGSIAFPILASECAGLQYSGPVLRTDNLVSRGFESIPVVLKTK